MGAKNSGSPSLASYSMNYSRSITFSTLLQVSTLHNGSMNKESIRKCLIGSRFHAKLRILSTNAEDQGLRMYPIPVQLLNVIGYLCNITCTVHCVIIVSL